MFRFSDEQLNKLADITADIGLVALASVVLPALLDKFKPTVLIVGLASAIFFWYFSLRLLKRKT